MRERRRRPSGSASTSTDRDTIASTHRGHGHCIAKGVDVEEMMAEIFGRQTGSCRGKGGSMHIADLSKGMLGANGIVGGGPPLICGTALAAKLKGTGGVAVAFFGDGASNQGTTLEALNLASVWDLPAIFVAENNGYAETTSSSWSVSLRQHRRPGRGLRHARRHPRRVRLLRRRTRRRPRPSPGLAAVVVQPCWR